MKNPLSNQYWYHLDSTSAGLYLFANSDIILTIIFRANLGKMRHILLIRYKRNREEGKNKGKCFLVEVFTVVDKKKRKVCGRKIIVLTLHSISIVSN